MFSYALRLLKYLDEIYFVYILYEKTNVRSVTVQLWAIYTISSACIIVFLLYFWVQWKQNCMYLNLRALSKKTQNSSQWSEWDDLMHKIGTTFDALFLFNFLIHLPFYHK